MADTIRPWIAEYLIDYAERFGGDLNAGPLHGKKKKVQIVEVGDDRFQINSMFS
jgi:hypothetical protein